MSADEFREAGHALIERIAEFYESLPDRPVTPAGQRDELRALLGDDALPARGTPAGELLAQLAPLLFAHSLHNGHPKFYGYITSSAAPLGALAELLAAAVNSNVGLWRLSPLASEIEAQSIRWIAELIGYPAGCGGLMVSGGNAANFFAFVAARTAKLPWDIRAAGLCADARKPTAYVSTGTHTWIEKAVDICGIGADGIGWVDTDASQRMQVDVLSRRVEQDRRRGRLPFMVVATAGTVGTGAIDPLIDIAAFCREQDLWLHVDGAYGAPAAALPEAPRDLHALALADSVALDPHKWLYNPIEAACVLTREPRALPNAFSFLPEYYRFDDDPDAGIDYFQYGLQNTRGFRALKVWLNLRQAGSDGYRQSIRDDIGLARELFRAAERHPELDARSNNLSITTFRYRPAGLAGPNDAVRAYLNELNKALVADIQNGGEAFLSNAVVDGDYLLRACVVNFRATLADIESIPEIVVGAGRKLDKLMRPAALSP